MVLGEIAKREGVSNVGFDVFGVEAECSVGADGDGDVFCEGEGEEREKCERNGGMHCGD